MKNTLRALAGAAAVAALLGGCTTIETAPLPPALAAQLHGQNVGVVIQEPSTFGVMQTRDVALGPLGVLNMNAEGARLRREGHIGDPAEDIATLLGDSLAGRNDAVILPTRGKAHLPDVERILAAAPPDSRYVLTVATVSWGIMNLPLPRTDMQVTYTARARLIDVRTRAVIAEGGCLQAPDGSEYHAATYKDFSADNGALAKTELAARVDRCIHFIQRDMLGL
ncbi:MAG TPA: hypothetical protein VIP05_09270 [Burkholderiaceae bacterium]